MYYSAVLTGDRPLSHNRRHGGEDDSEESRSCRITLTDAVGANEKDRQGPVGGRRS